ncbi:MAG: lysophospholipid acyltransferase family protein [Alphaproteobacteria bacterium]|nr:lysophospholipid acyltransferase family protein [Alphaproteobacteria bacterium]
MITLFLFACLWICTIKGMKASAPMTYVFFAFLVITAIFNINAIYLLPIAAIYAVLAIIGVFAPWPEITSRRQNKPIKRIWKHPRELFGYRIMNALFYFLPLPVLSWLGGTALQTFGPLIKSRQDTMRKNLEMTLPDCANDEFMKRVWNNWGRTFVEGLKFTTYRKHMDKYITYRNKQMIHERPQFILAMPHFGSMGIMALAFVNSGLRLAATYKQATNPLTNHILLQNYGYGNVNEEYFIPVGNAIPMVRALRNGEILDINSDQRIHDAPYIEFIGVPARTSTGVSQLARKFNLPVLVGHVERTHGAHHEIVFDEFVEMPHTDDENADILDGMKLVNDAMSRVIKNKPDEYLWLHRRWK